MSLIIFYAPQPDENYESSAAYEYARRASDQFSAGNNDGQVFIHRLSLDSLDNLLFAPPTTVATGNASPTINPPITTIILLSCSADGSVDRTVRKLIRNLKQHIQQQNSSDSRTSPSETSSPRGKTKVAIALLGHATCENSANQMKDTIFNHGRKFQSTVSQMADTCSSAVVDVTDTIEIQVELEGPDAPGGFDDWLNSNIRRASKSHKS